MMGAQGRRVYYRVLLEATSALSIGGADNVQTDVDAVLDSRGRPMVPATSLTGALRAHLDPLLGDALFGTLDGEGVFRVYDATYVSGNEAISIRDNVSLKNRVARQGRKFDREVVEQGARFCTIIEVMDDSVCLLGTEKAPSDVAEYLIAVIHCGDVRLGAKKTRGLGCLSVTACKRRDFDLTDAAEREQWLGFDPFEEAHWDADNGARDLTGLVCEEKPRNDVAVMTLVLKQAGGVSVREYTTEPSSYDYSQLTVHGLVDEGGKPIELPIIPGTSWAGAFRERYESLSFDSTSVSRLFGVVKGSDVRKSCITFSESTLEGGYWKTYTRTAIDRFTGGTIPGALFTQRSYYDGSTTLELRIENLGQFSVKDMRALIGTLADLHNGFLTVGGLASVGHGLFRISSVGLRVFGEDRSALFGKALLRASEEVPEMIVPSVDEAAGLLVDCEGEGDER